MNLNRVKLGRAFTFMKYLTRVVFLMFVPEALIRNKITFSASNSLKLAELLVSEILRSNLLVPGSH